MEYASRIEEHEFDFWSTEHAMLELQAHGHTDAESIEAFSNEVEIQPSGHYHAPDVLRWLGY